MLNHMFNLPNCNDNNDINAIEVAFYLFIVMKNNTMKYNSRIGQNTGISNTMKNVIKKAVTDSKYKHKIADIMITKNITYSFYA